MRRYPQRQSLENALSSRIGRWMAGWITFLTVDLGDEEDDGTHNSLNSDRRIGHTLGTCHARPVDNNRCRCRCECLERNRFLERAPRATTMSTSAKSETALLATALARALRMPILARIAALRRMTVKSLARVFAMAEPSATTTPFPRRPKRLSLC